MQEIGDQHLTVALFDKFPIRRTWHDAEWYYSAVDIMAALVDSPTPKRYWSELKGNLKRREAFDVYAEGVVKLRLPAHDGRMLLTDCANRQTVLRLIQSVPSPNAGPFKRWLALVGNAVLEDAEETDETRSLRAQHRLKLHEVDTHLHQLVMFRGITTPEQHDRLRDSNYAGLYAVATRDEIARIRRLPFSIPPEEAMGVMEMAANIFQRAGTAQVVEERNLQGEETIIATAEDVGVQIRLTMERMGVTMPESLPRYRALHHTEWLPSGEPGPGHIDWDAEIPEADDRVIPIYELAEPAGDPNSDHPHELRLLEERHIQPRPSDMEDEE
ncbi:MAG: hypothetical protein H0X24_13805 [Ktedonobacterales bacterium]|nr:hypothetical protein [Ktedonobacterales bacterium]